MSRTLAHEFGPSARVTSILPGPFATDISKVWRQTQNFKARVQDIAMQRIGKPDEIAGAALYLASDAFSYTTGASLRVYGA